MDWDTVTKRFTWDHNACNVDESERLATDKNEHAVVVYLDDKEHWFRELGDQL